MQPTIQSLPISLHRTILKREETKMQPIPEGVKTKIEQKNKLRHIILDSHDISFSFAFYLFLMNDIE